MSDDPFGQVTLESMSTAVWYNQWVLNKFKNYLRGDILEVGCGIGNFTRELASYGVVTAIDIQREYIPDVEAALKGVAEVGYGDIEKGKYFFQKKRFDSIVCLNVLEHIAHDVQAVQNMIKLLKPSGTLIVIVPSGMNLYGSIDKAIGHFRRYSKKDIFNVFRRLPMKIVVNRRLNILGGVGWFVAGKIFRNKVVRQDQVNLFNLIAPVVLPIEDLFEPPFGTSVLIISQKK